MIRRDAILALVLACMLILVARAQPDPTYLPVARAIPADVTRYEPPNGLECLLQQGTSSYPDPRTGLLDISCEAKAGHGQIVWTDAPGGPKLLLDHAQAGSGSLAPVDGELFLTVVSEDGAVWRYRVPTP